MSDRSNKKRQTANKILSPSPAPSLCSDGSVHIIKPNGYMETRALCEQINKQTATEMMAVVHYTTGW